MRRRDLPARPGCAGSSRRCSAPRGRSGARGAAARPPAPSRRSTRRRRGARPAASARIVQPGPARPRPAPSPAPRSGRRSVALGAERGEGRREGKVASGHSVLGVPVPRGDPLSASETYPPWPPFHFLLHFSSPRLSLSLLWMTSLLPSFLDCRPLSSLNTCPFPGPHWTHSPSWLLHSAHPHPLHQV